jgi:diguanylate cyclase (GGDEF)-like protein/PAS domain S-box-containing protein
MSLMRDGAQRFSRLDAKRREQTPQALARLVVVTLFVGLWFVLWLARIPMPLPFLIALLIEILFFVAYWRVVFFLPTVRAVTAAQYIMLGTEILFHTTMVYFLGSLSWLGAFAYVFGVIFANAFLDLRRGMIYTAGACAAFATLILLEATGTIPHYVYLDQGPLRYTDPRFVVTTLVSAIGVFISVHLWSSWVGHQLRRERDTAVRAQDDLLEARVQLLRVNEELEERVHARTADLETANVALSESQQQLRLVLETCPDLISIQEPDGRYRFVNSAFTTELGYGPAQLNGQTAVDIIHPDDVEAVSERFVTMVNSRLPAEATFRVRHADGHWVTLEANGQVLVDEQGEPTGVVVVSRDVTERIRAEDALRESEETLKITIESTADGILVIHPERRVAYANRRFIEMWHLPEELAAAGNDSNDIVPYVRDQLEHPDEFIATVAKIRRTPGEWRDTLRCKDGSVIEIYARAMLKDEQIVGRVVSFRDVTEQKRAEEALTAQARRDPLTGLLNRRAGLSAVEERLAYAKETRRKLAVLILDLDRFKLINDRYSHETGDAALIRFSQVMTKLVGERGVVCRLGGDEFEIALDGVGLADAVRFAERLRTSLRRSLKQEQAERLPPFTVSSGIACYPEDGQSSADLARRADEAMYAAKAGGADTVCAWRELGNRQVA